MCMIHYFNDIDIQCNFTFANDAHLCVSNSIYIRTCSVIYIGCLSYHLWNAQKAIIHHDFQVKSIQLLTKILEFLHGHVCTQNVQHLITINVSM